jgi:hypothetical protein
METIKIGYTEENPGQKSAARLIFVWGYLWLFLICSYIIVSKVANLTEVGIFFGIVASILSATKVVQKTAENKPDLKTGL